GNFEGKNILHVPDEPSVVAARLDVPVEQVYATIERARPILYDARAARVWPARDDKIIASWNGLMLRAVAECARVFTHDAWRALAIANGEFLFREMVRDDRVMRVHTAGLTKLNGYLEDHAAVALGALALYELTFDRIWLDRARALGESMITWFWDDSMGAFSDTSSDHETLVMRPREVTDNATPSGTSLAVELMQRLAVLFDDDAMRHRANWVLETLVDPVSRYPAAFGHVLGNATFAIHGALEVAISGAPAAADFRALTTAIAAQYLPDLVLAGGPESTHTGVALLTDRPMRDGHATAYVCRDYTCKEPVTEPARVGELLAGGW
ncbi:MAG: thioredoxin domain-containing protein, partial [Gemmatimonadaceae bacterium]